MNNFLEEVDRNASEAGDCRSPGSSIYCTLACLPGVALRCLARLSSLLASGKVV